jgi:hypothetical protein
LRQWGQRKICSQTHDKIERTGNFRAKT